MELDEMKMVWQRMDQLLQTQQNLIRKTETDRQLGRVRQGLRPLFWGQIVQMAMGVVLILLAVSYWTEHRDVGYQLACGLVVHAYGVVAIVLAGITISKIGKIDYAAPVTTIQRQLEKVRSFYILNGMLVGLPWWLLWILVAAVVFGLLGVDLFVNAPEMVFWSAVAGVIGLCGTWLFHRWAHDPKRAEFGKRLDDGAAGSSLTKARNALEEIEAFETE